MNHSNGTLLLKSLSLGLVTDYIDYIVRIGALLIHLIYILFIIYFKEFQIRSMVFLHHVNIVSTIYCIHYVFYIGNQTASFSSDGANDFLCYLSEMIWINLKFLRLYSLLLLAVYRYTSVFRIQFHRTFNNNLYRMFLSIAAVWVFSIIMSFFCRASNEMTSLTEKDLTWLILEWVFSMICCQCYILRSLLPRAEMMGKMT